MAKQRRSTTRLAGKKTARPKRPAAAKTARPKRPAAAKTARPKRPAAAKTARRPQKVKRSSAPVTKLRTDYLKAVKLYEKGLQALQRRHFNRAATTFRQVMKLFPDERELHERANLYLNICARESSPKKRVPRTTNEKIFAATIALNRRDSAEAISLLEKAVSSHPSDDRLHYMLALAHALNQDTDSATNHLAKAISLNPENRIQAREEADFDSIRETEAFIEALKSP